MRKDFIRTARQLLLGPSLAAGLLAPGFARAETAAPDLQNIPITRIDSDAFFSFTVQQLPAVSEDLATLRGTAGLTSLALDIAKNNLTLSLNADHGAEREKLKLFIRKNAIDNMSDQPVQSSVEMQRVIEHMSTEDLVGMIARSGPYAVHLRNDINTGEACVDFLSSDPDILWREIMEDMGVKTQKRLPSVAKFVNDHEARHCADPRLSDNGVKSIANNVDDFVLDTEITADLAAAEGNKDNLPLLRGVARYRLMEAAVGVEMMDDSDIAVNHSSAFELWRYIDSLDGGKEKHTYLDKRAMKGAFQSFRDDIASAIDGIDYQGQLAPYYPDGENIDNHLFSNLYIVSRAMLEKDKFTKPESIMIAQEYVAAFEYFDDAFETGFKGKVTQKFKEHLDDQEDVEPSAPVAAYQTASSMSARP